MSGNHPSDTRGQGIIEYALIMVLVAVVVVIVLAFVGTQVSQVFSQITNAFQPGAGDNSEPPPECYGTLLLPVLLGLTGIMAGSASLLARMQRPALT